MKKSYEEMTHFYGRIWVFAALGMLLMYPVVTCIYYGAWPGWMPVLKGLIGVAPIYWTVGLIEVLTFVPMLGTGSSYLAFVTGNLTNLKVPAALTAMENAKVKPGSEEGEVISTIAVATSLFRNRKLSVLFSSFLETILLNFPHVFCFPIEKKYATPVPLKIHRKSANRKDERLS